MFSGQQPFVILPSRFLLLAMALYIGLELLGASALAYTDVLFFTEQGVILSLRLCELMGLLLLIWHFKLFETLGLARLSRDDLRIFLLISLFCLFMVVVLYAIQPIWFSYVSLPPWLEGVRGLVLMTLLAPMAEELVFRGLLYRMLREQWGVLSSVVVSALFFSLIHDGLLVSPQLAGGIIFAVAYEWSRSLWVSIALHMGANSAVYLIAL